MQFPLPLLLCLLKAQILSAPCYRTICSSLNVRHNRPCTLRQIVCAFILLSNTWRRSGDTSNSTDWNRKWYCLTFYHSTIADMVVHWSVFCWLSWLTLISQFLSLALISLRSTLSYMLNDLNPVRNQKLLRSLGLSQIYFERWLPDCCLQVVDLSCKMDRNSWA